MLTVVPPALDGLRPTKRGSACLRILKFRSSLDVVHFRYGSSVPFPQLPTPPRGGAVEFMLRREQSNSTGGTFTHAKTSFTGAGFVSFSSKPPGTYAEPGDGLIQNLVTRGPITAQRPKRPQPVPIARVRIGETVDRLLSYNFSTNT